MCGPVPWFSCPSCLAVCCFPPTQTPRTCSPLVSWTMAALMHDATLPQSWRGQSPQRTAHSFVAGRSKNTWTIIRGRRYALDPRSPSVRDQRVGGVLLRARARRSRQPRRCLRAGHCAWRGGSLATGTCSLTGATRGSLAILCDLSHWALHLTLMVLARGDMRPL
jgi:hypothetical protein